MALIRKVRGHEPVIGENTFLAETAVILGNVTIGRDCSIWYNAVLRGDVNRIVIGDRTNIQDGAVLHTIYDKAKHPSQTIIGNDVSVGHNATIHGAVIEDNCLIGMGATVLDNAHVPSGCIIAANALWQHAAKLPEIEIRKPDSILTGETTTGMQAGLVYGYIGQTEYIIRKIIEESGYEDVKVVATGGLGKMIAEETDCIDYYDANLTLKGLQIIYDKQKR